MNRIIYAGTAKLKIYLNEVINEERKALIGDFLSNIDELILTDDELLVSGSDEVSVRLQKLMTICGDNDIAITLLELCMAVYFDQPTANALRKMEILSEQNPGISVLFAAQVLGYSAMEKETILKMSDAYDKASRFLYIESSNGERYQQSFLADACLISWMTGIDRLDDRIAPHASLKSLAAMREDFSKIYAFNQDFKAFGDKIKRFSESEFIIAAICGERGLGKKSCAIATALCFEKPILFLEYETILATEDIRALLQDLLRHCFLLDAIPCLQDVTKGETIKELLKEFTDENSLSGKPLLMTCEPDVKMLPFFENVCEYRMEKPQFEESVIIWENLLRDAGLDGILDVESIVCRMKLTPGQIYLIVKNLKRYALEQGNKEIPESELFKICYQILDDSRYENVKRVKSGFTLDDLKVTPRNRAILKNVCNEVIQSKKVYRDWGMDKKYSYGRCVSLLLAGSPGTGKTMAVHAIASELGLELYKVDLSQITDKYIGETQKRLEEVFTNAEKSNMILFFDEADAVIGKRSETKDSHDKYANGEISFILQRMEEYDGIVVLATNYLQNIDVAFMRRIKFVVNIEKPVEEIRKEIWMSAFAENVPRAKDIDFDFLAKQFNISGGNIKNIVLNAVFFAAADNEPVSMMHVMHAVYYENTKEKRVAFTMDYGKYGYLLKNIEQNE